MSMNTNALKVRLAELNKSSSNNSKKEKKDYTKIYWKPKEEGKYQIRIVPSIENLDTAPFHEVMTHYGLTRFPIRALTNWGEQDPVVDFCKKLRDEGGSENWRLAKQLDPKLRVFVPIIVRGEEDMGVRLFEMSKTLYMEVLNILTDPDYGDIFDVSEGRDFTLTATPAGDRPGFNISMIPKVKQSPLTEDEDQLNDWLENQPLVLEESFKYTYENLKEVLKEYLNPENSNKEEQKEESKSYKPATTSEKKIDYVKKSTKVDEFDQIFDGEDDDLPF